VSTSVITSSLFSVPVPVCPFGCSLADLYNRMPEFRQIFCIMFSVAVAWLFSEGNAISYVLPVLWMASYSRIIESELVDSETACIFRQVRQVAAPGMESAISDCILFDIATLCN